METDEKSDEEVVSDEELKRFFVENSTQLLFGGNKTDERIHLSKKFSELYAGHESSRAPFKLFLYTHDTESTVYMRIESMERFVFLNVIGGRESSIYRVFWEYRSTHRLRIKMMIASSIPGDFTLMKLKLD